MPLRSDDDLPVNFPGFTTEPAPPPTPDPALAGPLYVPPNRRHGISNRVARNEASKAELLHHLLGAYADDTLTGGLSETQILAELLADHLEADRHLGTLARSISNRLEILTGLAEQAELERTGK